MTSVFFLARPVVVHVSEGPVRRFWGGVITALSNLATLLSSVSQTVRATFSAGQENAPIG